MPIKELIESGTSLENSHLPLVDIVIIHDLLESAIETCTDSTTGNFWLLDLFPYKFLRSRILLYDYKTQDLLLPGNSSADQLLALATTLVSELTADRQLLNAFDRPLVFICHGFGGLIIKRALALSHSRLARAVVHLRSLYISTYAILFMSTPHYGIRKEALPFFYTGKATAPNQFLISLLQGSEVLSEVTDQFAPLMKRYCIYNFWEETETQVGDFRTHIVDKESAAPMWDNVERCGISTSHSRILKFTGSSDPGYRVVLEALTRYIRLAPRIIASRWAEERRFIATERHNEAEALLQSQLEQSSSDSANATHSERIVIVPRCSSVQFTGRQIQARMVKENFERDRNLRGDKHKIVVIYGLGGSGKTQFCLRYAEENLSSYWGIFWIDATTRETAEAGFAFLGAQAGKGASFSAGKYWLSQCSKPWLLVLDNADDPDIDVSEFFPHGGLGNILITTRNPNTIIHATAGHIRFRGMDPEEAISLLLKSAYPEHTSTEPDSHKRSLAQSIAAELGYLALALTQAGATIRRNIYTLEKYLHFYLGYRNHLISLPNYTSVDETNVIATWEIPFQRIERRQSLEHKDAVSLLHIFAFLHFESIPEQIFQQPWSTTDSSRPTGFAHPGFIQDNWSRSEEAQVRLRRAIGVLCDYSIIDHDPERGVCSLHPVIHRWARDRFSESERKEWLSCAVRLLAGCISPNLEASGRGHRKSLLPHIDSCIRNLKFKGPAFPNTKDRANEIERFAWVYVENGLWKSALTLQHSVIEFRIRILGKTHKDTVRAKRSLGQIYWNLFEVKSAIETQRQVLEAHWWSRPSLADWLCWPPWKPDHISYCVALDDLTATLWLAGKRELSNMTGERAVNGLIRRLGPEDPKSLDAMFNLARTYLHLGDLEKSHELLIQVLKKRKKLFGWKHPDTLMTRNELGMNLCARKKHMAVAEQLVTNVLEARKGALGEEHAYTLWSVNDLSKILCERGRPGQAAKMLEDLLPVVRRTLGEEHVGMTMTKSNLARAYVLSQRWKDAEALLCQMLAVISDDHPDWFDCMSGYVHVQIQLGRLEEAEKNCNKMLEIIGQTKILAMDHPRTIAVAQQLAKVYRATRRSIDIASLEERIPALKGG